MVSVIVFCFIALLSNAQSSAIQLGTGSYFKFNNGIEEWSEPITVDLKTYEGDKSIPIQIRIKFKKRLVLACHYYVEITNLSDAKKVTLSYGNGYSDYSGKKIWNKAKIKPKGVYEGKIIYAASGFKPKGGDDCIACSWKFEFVNVKIK